MITEEHLRHWMSEILYANNGISGSVNHDGMEHTDGVLIGGSTLSLNYIREKTKMIETMIECINKDIEVDGKV